jgi:hypothetical protein
MTNPWRLSFLQRVEDDEAPAEQLWLGFAGVAPDLDVPFSLSMTASALPRQIEAAGPSSPM